MKKTVYSIVCNGLLAVALLTFNSCKEDEVVVEPPVTTVTLRATIDSEAETRTVFNADTHKAEWVVGDSVNINGTNYAAQSGGASTSFTGVVSAGSYTAYYPASLYKEGTFTLPATQTYDGDPVVNAPMYAYSTDEDINFKNLCGVLRLTLKGSDTVKRIVLSADQPMSGTFDVNTDNLETPYAVIGSGTEGVTLDCGTGVTLTDEGVIFNIVMPKDTFTNLKIGVVNQIGAVQTLTAARFTVERSQFEKATAKVTDFQQEYVDLGLPSGLLWAAWNVGALAPEEYGDYFAWGETDAKTDFSWTNYTWCNGSQTTLTKYNTDSSYGPVVDNKMVLEAADDAATQNWGSGWRMPTKAEWDELLSSTTNQWTSRSTASGTVYGYEFFGNGQTLFLPAAGYRYDTYLSDAGSYGYYWSSSLIESYPGLAWSRGFGSGGVYADNGSNRCYGRSVRAVYGPRTLSASSTSLEQAPAGGTNTSITLTGNDSWTAAVTTGSDWLSVTPANGCGDGKLSITTTENTSAERTGIITITCGEAAAITIAVTQMGKYVDLGLPSGLLWASYNIGATAPEQYGGYFAWGDKEGYNSGHDFSWSTYKLCNGSNNTLTKYNTDSSYGTVDNKTVLEADDDAATQNWGSPWRMPTQDEWQELVDNTTSEWVSGKKGRIFTSKTNGKTIFLPAAGLWNYAGLFFDNTDGNYWSSSLHTDPSCSCDFIVNDRVATISSHEKRYYGLSVRPVRPKN